MTNIHPKLTAAITTIAILAPAAGAQASHHTPARHATITTSARHATRHNAHRPTVKRQRDNNNWR